jgi:hypothetical protein
MSMVVETSDHAFLQHLSELAVNGTITLVLVLAYYLVSRLETVAKPGSPSRGHDAA